MENNVPTCQPASLIFSELPKTVYLPEKGFILPKKLLKGQKSDPNYYKSELERLKKKAEYFAYEDNDDMNDIRAGYRQFKYDIDKFMGTYEEIVIAITDSLEYYDSIYEQAQALVKIAKAYQASNKAYEAFLLNHNINPIAPTESANQLEQAVEHKVTELQRRKDALDKVEEEIVIAQDQLQKKKTEMERALAHRYTLTPAQKQVLLEEKDLILDGIEQWGSIYSALKHNPAIKSKPTTVQMYAYTFPEFGEAITVSKNLFKDRLQSIMIERAIEGTENPVFGKGEYIGDYKIKDNRLLLELMKAKVPEEYNKKSVETVKNQQVNNMNIISFANVDETKKGYTRNVGVVLDVDETGKVERVTQENKMRDYYKKKPGAEIIMPDEPEEEE